MSRVDFKPSTVDRLRKLTIVQLEEERTKKREEVTGVKRNALLEEKIYEENVDWDYGWVKRLTYLAETGEVVAFNAVLMRMDTAPKDVVYTIFEETDDLELLHARYKNDPEWFKEFMIPLCLRRETVPDSGTFLICSLFTGTVGDYILDPRVRKEYDRRFYSFFEKEQSKGKCCGGEGTTFSQK